MDGAMDWDRVSCLRPIMAGQSYGCGCRYRCRWKKIFALMSLYNCWYRNVPIIDAKWLGLIVVPNLWLVFEDRWAALLGQLDDPNLDEILESGADARVDKVLRSMGYYPFLILDWLLSALATVAPSRASSIRRWRSAGCIGGLRDDLCDDCVSTNL
ncbi:hypothetical protein Nepgr_009315 [Nepenthes gracilis]|uniref:Uncharacterized protein n=1 Tax=Nepenthes gracilis TaxID=150966 RepID=A0AAD3SAD3_NEPGR|nr:hypothetical protein Nepgr_009315 [Nepenthes gracilis]